MEERSVLVVEDEQTLRRLLRYRLQDHYHVRTAWNGEQALELIKERIPDLIVSDIMMPGIDGYELQQKLQDKKHTRVIPFIFLTAKMDDASRLQGMRTGVDDYITKPFDVEQLMMRVERLLERAETFRQQLGGRIGQDSSQRLIPKNLPEEDGYRFFFKMDPREHGGGDMFDWTEPWDGSYFFTIGDVMGKGLQAKFYAFSFLSYMRGTLHAMLSISNSPAELMKHVNMLLMKDAVLEETFASLLLMRWEPASHTVTYANAGHSRPVLVTQEGTELIEYSDMILGLDPETTFDDKTVELPPECAFVVYTDGLLEQTMPGGRMLGENGALEYVQKAYGKENPVDALLDSVLSDSTMDAFEDDILVFWFERTG